jgi:hypothetical protein
MKMKKPMRGVDAVMAIDEMSVKYLVDSHGSY